MKKGLIAGMVLVGLLAVMGPAKACLIEDEPSRGHRFDAYHKADRHWSDSHSWYSPEPDPPAVGRHRQASSSRWDRDDNDWKFDHRSRHFDRHDSFFRDRHDWPVFGWFPTMFLGGKWGDLFKDLPKWEDYFDKDPAFVIFGGRGHQFIGFIFPYASSDLPPGSDPPPNGTPTPIPAGIVLLGTGICGVWLMRFKQGKKSEDALAASN
jgi:hypothetical protein